MPTDIDVLTGERLDKPVDLAPVDPDDDPVAALLNQRVREATGQNEEAMVEEADPVAALLNQRVEEATTQAEEEPDDDPVAALLNQRVREATGQNDGEEEEDPIAALLNLRVGETMAKTRPAWNSSSCAPVPTRLQLKDAPTYLQRVHLPELKPSVHWSTGSGTAGERMRHEERWTPLTKKPAVEARPMTERYGGGSIIIPPLRGRDRSSGANAKQALQTIDKMWDTIGLNRPSQQAPAVQPIMKVSNQQIINRMYGNQHKNPNHREVAKPGRYHMLPTLR